MKNTIETHLGAIIASVIAFGTGALALLQQEGVNQLSDVSGIAWIVLAIGASLTFLKDLQALATRRFLANATGSGNVNSPPLVGVLAVILAALVISGCAGTKSAYKAAEGLSETAYVLGEHYYAEIRAINRLDDAGRLSASDLKRLQKIAYESRPIVVAMLDAANSYDIVKSSDNEATLGAAIANAATAVANLVNAIKGVGGSTLNFSACDAVPIHAARDCFASG